MWRVSSANPASTIVLFRFGASSATRERSCLEHCSHRIYRPNRFLIPWPVLRRYYWVHLSQRSYASQRAGSSATSSPKASECVDEIALSWFLEGSSFDPVCSDVAVAISSEVDWTGLRLLDSWFPYFWEAGKVLDFPGGHKMVSRQRPLDGVVPLPSRALLARTILLLVSLSTGCFRWMRLA